MYGNISAFSERGATVSSQCLNLIISFCLDYKNNLKKQNTLMKTQPKVIDLDKGMPIVFQVSQHELPYSPPLNLVLMWFCFLQRSRSFPSKNSETEAKCEQLAGPEASFVPDKTHPHSLLSQQAGFVCFLPILENC